DDGLRTEAECAANHHHVIVCVSVDCGVTTHHDDRFAGGRVGSEVVTSQHPEVHAVMAIAAPSLPLVAPGLMPLLDALASLFAGFAASLACVFTALPRRVALILNRPVGLRLCKRGRR